MTRAKQFQRASPRLPRGRTCEVPGCLALATGYRRMCEKHRRTAHRHGHPEQVGLKLGELRPYEKAAREFIERRDDAARVWGVLEEHWRRFAEWADGEIKVRESGRPTHRYTTQACYSIRAVSDENDARDIMLRLIAFAWVWLEDSRRFRSDRAARFQVARVFRRMTDQHVGQSVSPTDGKAKRYYKDPPAKTSERLGELLFKVIMPSCLSVVRKVQSEEEKEKERVKEMQRVIQGEENHVGA